MKNIIKLTFTALIILLGINTSFAINWCNNLKESDFNNISKEIIKSNSWNSEAFLVSKDWRTGFVINCEIPKYYFNQIKYSKITFSNNWENYIYNTKDEKWDNTIVKDWELIENDNWIWRATISYDWKEYAYLSAINWSNYHIIKNWKKIEWYEQTFYPKFSHIDNSFSFIWLKNWTYYLVINWEENKVYFASLYEYNEDWNIEYEGRAYKVSYKKTNNKEVNIKPELKSKIDSLVLKSSIVKLNKLNNTLSKIDLNSKKYSKYKDILEYLKESINEKLNK